MADFSALVRSMVGVADTITKSLQATVLHWPYETRDVWNAETQKGSISRQCVLENKQKYVRNASGDEVLTNAKLTFPVPISIGILDNFTVPDGTVYTVQAFEGPVGNDGKAFVTTVYIG